MERWLKKMGYRLALRRIRYPGTVRPGGTLSYETWWGNMGVAPCYRPYRWAFRFAGERTSRVVCTDADIRAWLPGDHLHNSAIHVPDDLPPGSYRLETAIIDALAEVPILQLAMEGKQADGWYALGGVSVDAE